MAMELTREAPSERAQRAAWARNLTTTRYLPHKVLREDRSDGCILLRSAYELPPVTQNTGSWLHRWAKEAPNRTAVSERDESAGWRDVTYADLLQHVRAVGSALLSRGLGSDDAVVVLSGNGIDHLILSLAAQYVGVPVVSLAEQYALLPEAHARLIQVLDKVRPAIAFVDDASRFVTTLALPQLASVEIVAARGKAGRQTTPFSDLLAGAATTDVDAAHAKVGPDTVAKILFTSGSSGDPKGVLTTHRMMCINQAQMTAVLPCLTDEPPRLTDWLPWNHVFGGSYNVNLILSLGGTLTIDAGKPVNAGFATTLHNLRERPGTLAFNVPVGFAMLVAALERDPDLLRRVFKDVELVFYAGASLPQDVWEGLERCSLEARGGLPLMISSWGLTETAPACLVVHEPIGRSGVVGVPLPGVTIKLIPDEDQRCEIRVKGPNVMPGYYKDPEKTSASFDEEGFFISGDAVRFVDPTDASRGLIFDGRMSEDFKLQTGTWVQAGRLRMNALKQLEGLAQDVVVCGHDRLEIGLMIFPLSATLAPEQTSRGAVTDPRIKALCDERLRAMNAHASTPSAQRITRALILAESPSIAHQEITDKGSLNAKKILARRGDLLERLYDNDDPALIRF